MIISVIIPFYNGLKYIENMLNQLERNNQNLIKQISDAKLEAIIVNDSPSTKLFVDVIKYSYDISLFNNEKNLGIQKSRINGFYKSRGEYILFLDQDDIISDFCILEHIKNIIKNNLDISISNCIVQYKNKNKLLYNNKSYFKKIYNIDFMIKYRNLIMSPGQCLIRKKTIPYEWLEYILVNNGSDDYLLWLVYFNNKNVVGIIEKNLYIHTQSNDNFSNDLLKMYKSSKEVINLIIEKNIFSKKNSKKLKINFDKYWKLKLSSKHNIISFVFIHPLYTMRILKYHFFNFHQSYSLTLYKE